MRTTDKIRNDARLLYAFLSDTPDASGALGLVLAMGGKNLISEPAPQLFPYLLKLDSFPVYMEESGSSSQRWPLNSSVEITIFLD